MFAKESVAISEIPGRWWLLHTRPRNEKALAWDLWGLEIDYFLPLVRASRTYGRHKQEVILPLFSGYMFCACVSEEQRFAALDTRRIAKMVSVPDQTVLRNEMEQISRALATPHKVDLFPGIKAGRRCRVSAGSLKGLEGVVVSRRGMSRIYLEVSILGQSAAVEIDALLVETVD